MNLSDKKTLTSMLSFVYHTMRASIPLLEAALRRADDAILREYFERHIDEETGHDAMLRDDLYRLGMDDVALPHIAAQFAGSQYYLIEHEHPALLLGYMRALEGESMSVAEVDALSEYHGVDLTAMRHHAIHDPQHKRDLDAVIEKMDAPLQARIAWNESCVRKMMDRIEAEIVNGN
jgi:rubrerythrin